MVKKHKGNPERFTGRIIFNPTDEVAFILKKLRAVERKTGKYTKSDYGLITRILNAAVVNLVKKTTDYSILYITMELGALCQEREIKNREYDREIDELQDKINDLKFINKLGGKKK